MLSTATGSLWNVGMMLLTFDSLTELSDIGNQSAGISNALSLSAEVVAALLLETLEPSYYSCNDISSCGMHDDWLEFVIDVNVLSWFDIADMRMLASSWFDLLSRASVKLLVPPSFS